MSQGDRECQMPSLALCLYLYWITFLHFTSLHFITFIACLSSVTDGKVAGNGFASRHWPNRDMLSFRALGTFRPGCQNILRHFAFVRVAASGHGLPTPTQLPTTFPQDSWSVISQFHCVCLECFHFKFGWDSEHFGFLKNPPPTHT